MKYSAEMTSAICENLAAAMSREDTCAIVGINTDTFYSWLKKPEFSDAVKQAEFRAKRRNIGIIQAAAMGTKPFKRPNAFWAAWWLERKFPEEYAMTNKIAGPGGKPLATSSVTVTVPPLDPAMMKRLADAVVSESDDNENGGGSVGGNGSQS